MRINYGVMETNLPGGVSWYTEYAVYFSCRVLRSSHGSSEDTLFGVYVLGLSSWRRWTDDILHVLLHFYECVGSDAERNGSAEHLRQSFSKSVWGLFLGSLLRTLNILLTQLLLNEGLRDCPVVLYKT